MRLVRQALASRASCGLNLPTFKILLGPTVLFKVGIVRGAFYFKVQAVEFGMIGF